MMQRKVYKKSTVALPRSMAMNPYPSSAFKLKKITIYLFMLGVFVFALIYAGTKSTFKSSSAKIYTFEVVNEFPHDPKAFTQGLLYGGNDTLFESTGLYGQSSVREVFLQTGKVLALHYIGRSYFGEGLTLFGKRLLQVTWKEKTGFLYDRYNLSRWTAFTHQMNDGWGLATDGKVIFGSDGTSTLYQLDPHSFNVIGKVRVKSRGREIFYLNELEYVNGEVWANVWLTDCIARISPNDGAVIGWINLRKLREGLLASGNHNLDVLNGIAWDEKKNRLFVTGKLWPRLYEIKIKPANASLNVTEKICLPREVLGV